jgi:hypothetical protein
MSTRSDNPDHTNIPRTHTIKPIDTPPQSDQPTSAQLKADIDSGRSGDKNEVFDPGLSPLGTDDEAAGHTPSPERVALAREQERARWQNGGEKQSYAHNHSRKALYSFVGFIGLLVVLFVGAFSMF